MSQLLYTVREASFAALCMLPVFLCLHFLRFKRLKSTLFYFLFSVYLCGIYAVVGLPNVTYIRFDPNIQLIPVAPMTKDSGGSFLNVLMFLPLGFFLPLLWTKYRRTASVAVMGFSLSLAIEVLQIFTYRATDVNDLITNTLGAVLGYFVALPLLRRFPALHRRSNCNDFGVLILTAAAVMFFLQALIWMLLY